MAGSQDTKGEQRRKILFRQLKGFFGENEVSTKWRASKESRDALDKRLMYAPEIDIIVRPLNIRRRIYEDNRKIDRTVEEYKEFLVKINQLSEISYQEHALNRNPRCFLAIEVGGSGSEKHLLGDMFNASVLGKIGLIVAANQKTLNTYKRLYEYANFAYRVGKPSKSFENLAVISGKKFSSYMSSLATLKV